MPESCGAPVALASPSMLPRIVIVMVLFDAPLAQLVAAPATRCSTGSGGILLLLLLVHVASSILDGGNSGAAGICICLARGAHREL